MIKIKTLKNSYVKLKERFTHTITEEALNKYMMQLIEKIESVPEEERESIIHMKNFGKW